MPMFRYQDPTRTRGLLFSLDLRDMAVHVSHANHIKGIKGVRPPTNSRRLVMVLRFRCVYMRKNLDRETHYILGKYAREILENAIEVRENI